MADTDLPEVKASLATKIAGANPSTGAEDNYLEVDTSGKIGIKISDGAGSAVTSTVINAKQRLDVDLASEGTPAAAAPTIATQVAGTNPFTGKLQVPNVDGNGNQYGVLTSPNGLAAGIFAHFNPAGSLNVSIDSNAIFSDPFDGGTLDITNRWNSPITASGGAITLPGSGLLQITTGTTASAKAVLTSQPTFVEIGINFFVTGFIVQLEAAALTNVERFWGHGTTGTSYSSPLLDAVGFELVGSILSAVVYASGVKIFSQALTLPTDGLFHRYATEVGQGEVFWYIDNYTTTFELPVAFTSLRPTVETLPILVQEYNNSTPPASSPVFNMNGLAVADSGPNNAGICDGTYRWRKATVDSTGSLHVVATNTISVAPTDGTKVSYSAAAVGITLAALATDIFTITGSATKVVRITRIEITGSSTAGSGAVVNLQLIRRSAANTGGTSTSDTAVSHDTTDSTATATVVHYTVNPTLLGAAVGTVRSSRTAFVAAGLSDVPTQWEFGNRPSKAIVLRGTSQILALNIGGITVTGGVADINIEWTEE